MANAMSSVTEGNLVSYYNPALAVFQESNSFQTSYSFLSLDRSLNFINFTKRINFYEKQDSTSPERKIRSSAGISFGLINAGVSNIDGRDNSGNQTGSLSTSENQFFFAFSNQFSKKLALGIAIKYYYFKLYEEISANGFGLDIGGIYSLFDNLRVSFVISDINSKYKWDTSTQLGTDGSNTEESFPILKKIGLSYKNDEYKFITALEYETSGEGTNIIRFGGEINLIENLFLRGGIDQLNLSNSDFPIRPSLGFSYYKAVGSLVIGVDYAFVGERYSPQDRHIVGVNVRF